MKIALNRKHTGEYTFKWNDITFFCSRNSERDSSWYGEWMLTAFREDSAQDLLNSDPIRTLAKCRDSIDDLITHAEHYGLVKPSHVCVKCGTPCKGSHIWQIGPLCPKCHEAHVDYLTSIYGNS